MEMNDNDLDNTVTVYSQCQDEYSFVEKAIVSDVSIDVVDPGHLILIITTL
jgi:hypothetical protein